LEKTPAIDDVTKKKLSVFGGTGRTGRILVRLALAQGHAVTVLVRDKSKLGELAQSVTAVEGSVLDPSAVDRSIPPGTDAVLSTFGHTKGSPKDLETVGVGNIVSSMRRGGAKRLVVLASSVIGDPRDAPTASQRLVRWLVKLFRRDVYDDALTKGAVVRGSGLDWTMVRASLLTDSAPKRSYRIGAMDRVGGLRISRGEVAEFMLNCAIEGTHVREAPYLSD